MRNRIAAAAVTLVAALSAGAVAAHTGHGAGEAHTHVLPALPGYISHALADWQLVAVAAVIAVGVGAALRLLRSGRTAPPDRS